MKTSLANAVQLHTIDVNLLVVLDALLCERHVGRAAKRLGLSQSATSHALGRLRDLLGDEVLVRSGAGMHPTPKAEAIEADLHACLRALNATVFDHTDFDASRSQRKFTIASEGYFSATVLPILVRRCRTAAPGVRFDFLDLGASLFECVSTHRADLAVGVVPSEPPPGIDTEVLFEEGVACLTADGDASAPPDGLDLAQFVEREHILVGVGDPGPSRVDRLLAERGLRRDIVARVPNFLAAPFVALETGALFTCPRRLAERFESVAGLRLLDPPPELAFTFRYQQVWHKRVDRHPPQRWLREQVRLAAAEA